MLETGILLAQDSEFRRMDHQDLRPWGQVPMVEQMHGFGTYRYFTGWIGPGLATPYHQLFDSSLSEISSGSRSATWTSRSTTVRRVPGPL
jgi:hypothetical protein